MIDAQRRLPFRDGILITLHLIESGCQEQVRLEDFGHEVNRLAKRLERLLRMPGSVKREADEVVKLGRPWFQLEAILKGFECAVPLLVVAEPGSEFGVGVGVGLGKKLGFQCLGAGAGKEVWSYNQNGRKNRRKKQ